MSFLIWSADEQGSYLHYLIEKYSGPSSIHDIIQLIIKADDDLLDKPNLTKKEKDKLKTASKKLLETLKHEKLVLDWRKRQQTRADVLLTIQTILDEELPESYEKSEYERRCALIYQHIYDSYFGQDKSIYLQ